MPYLCGCYHCYHCYNDFLTRVKIIFHNYEISCDLYIYTEIEIAEW